MTKRFFLGFLGIIFAAMLGGEPIRAQSSVQSSHSSATLVSEKESLEPGKPFWLALTLDPADEWHTYWVNPGDSGAATIFDWGAPDGFTFDEALYPVPQKLPYDPLLNYGYKGPSTLLVRGIAPANLAETSTISLQAEWLVCKIECIPQFGTFTLNLPIGDGAFNDAQTTIFADARAALPEPGYWGANLAVNGEVALLTVFLSDEEMTDIANASYFPRYEGVTTYAEPQVVEVSDRGLLVRLKRYAGDVMPSSGDGVLVIDKLDGSSLGVSLLDVPIVDMPEIIVGGAATTLSEAAEGGLSPIAAFGFAFLAGILLNLMPCVFPVLSLKAFSFIQSGSMSAAERKKEGWAYTFGILSSFMIVVAVLVGLRSSGLEIGWGFQLQSPVFVAFLAILMALLGLSLAGLFDLTTGFDDAGQGLAAQGGARGAFFTGVLTTLVATPCTGPFMGAAIFTALTQPLPILVAIFLALGFGLAFPFLLLSYSPKIASLMPRPGAWMNTLKQALAFPLFLTAAWLLWIFTSVAGSDALFQLLISFIGIVFAIWLVKQGSATWLKAAATAIALSAGYFVYEGAEVNAEGGASAQFATGEVAFTASVLDDVVGGDRPVFAYFTADWCITCKVNERVALFRDETKQHFAKMNVQMVKGDWTNRNAEIAEVLKRYKRAGVPLYLYFPAGQSDPVVLPEVLTVGLLKETVS